MKNQLSQNCRQSDHKPSNWKGVIVLTGRSVVLETMVWSMKRKPDIIECEEIECVFKPKHDIRSSNSKTIEEEPRRIDKEPQGVDKDPSKETRKPHITECAEIECIFKPKHDIRSSSSKSIKEEPQGVDKDPSKETSSVTRPAPSFHRLLPYPNDDSRVPSYATHNTKSTTGGAAGKQMPLECTTFASETFAAAETRDDETLMTDSIISYSQEEEEEEEAPEETPVIEFILSNQDIEDLLLGITETEDSSIWFGVESWREDIAGCGGCNLPFVEQEEESESVSSAYSKGDQRCLGSDIDRGTSDSPEATASPQDVDEMGVECQDLPGGNQPSKTEVDQREEVHDVIKKDTRSSGLSFLPFPRRKNPRDEVRISVMSISAQPDFNLSTTASGVEISDIGPSPTIGYSIHVKSQDDATSSGEMHSSYRTSVINVLSRSFLPVARKPKHATTASRGGTTTSTTSTELGSGDTQAFFVEGKNIEEVLMKVAKSLGKPLHVKPIAPPNVKRKPLASALASARTSTLFTTSDTFWTRSMRSLVQPLQVKPIPCQNKKRTSIALARAPPTPSISSPTPIVQIVIATSPRNDFPGIDADIEVRVDSQELAEFYSSQSTLNKKSAIAASMKKPVQIEPISLGKMATSVGARIDSVIASDNAPVKVMKSLGKPVKVKPISFRRKRGRRVADVTAEPHKQLGDEKSSEKLEDTGLQNEETETKASEATPNDTNIPLAANFSI